MIDTLGVIIGSALQDGEEVELCYREPTTDKAVLTVSEPRVESVRFLRDGEVVFKATPREIMMAFMDIIDKHTTNEYGGTE